MFVFDAHLDLSMNALEWNRDLRQTSAAIRTRETGLTDKPDRGRSTVSFPDLRRGDIGMVVATQIARYVAPGNPLPGWHSAEQAWAQTQGQLAWYRAMEEAGELRAVTDLASLEAQLASWNDGGPTDGKPIGYILSLEGADSLVTLKHLERAYRYGLRAVGPAHYGPGRYANGTDSSGAMDAEGIALLREMDQLDLILDVTHLCDEAFFQALDHFPGPVWASHNNCRALVDHQRQFSDEQLKLLIDRGAVIGAALDAWMVVPEWKRGESDPREMKCNLEKVVDHIDHVCQLAGSCLHAGIGTDLDGGFGREQCPYDMDTIADVQKVPGLLRQRGYAPEDISLIMHGNWLRFLRMAWSDGHTL